MLLEGKLEEYRTAFNAVDNGGNGTISATEIAQLFESLGTPLSYDKLVRMMAKYDVDKSGQIDFYEFLRMFRDELLDLKEILDYIKMQPTQKNEQQAKVGCALRKESMHVLMHTFMGVDVTGGRQTESRGGAGYRQHDLQ